MITNKATFVYIDGFNFYYGALKDKGIGFKWLNISELLKKLLPNNKIIKIKYFTARVSGRFDPNEPIRQNLYFRALKTIPNLEIVLGSFMFNKKKIRVTSDVDILAMVPTEKGTDVNLAVHLLNDTRKERPEVVVIISNDSDLAEVVRIASQEMNVEVGILNPYEHFNQKLSRYSTFKKSIRDGIVTSSQFPDSLVDSNGNFSKPTGW